MHTTSATERQRQRRGAQGRPETVATTKMIHARKRTPERQRQHIRHGASTPSPSIDSPPSRGGSSSSLRPPLCGRTRMVTRTCRHTGAHACSHWARVPGETTAMGCTRALVVRRVAADRASIASWQPPKAEATASTHRALHGELCVAPRIAAARASNSGTPHGATAAHLDLPP